MRVFPTYGAGENNKRLFPSLLKAIKNNENFIIKNPLEKRDFSNVNFVSKTILDSLNFKKKKNLKIHRFGIFHKMNQNM